MTYYVDFEKPPPFDDIAGSYDIIIVGGGAAGLTLVRELAGQEMRIAVLESGALEETSRLEELNEVEVSPAVQSQAFQEARRGWHGPQMKFWSPETQKFGVRCRVLGGSTAAWAGKVAPLDTVDYEQRPWIPGSGWPFGADDMNPYVERAAQHLDLGPVVQGAAFWTSAARREPAELSRLRHFGAFFWQFARSRHALTDVMRLGPDFRRETHNNVTIFMNATAAAINVDNNGVTGVQIISSLTGRNRSVLRSNRIVLAAGAIENARLLLLSQDASGKSIGNANDTVGRYLMDHPSIEIGYFAAEDREKAATLLGFYPLRWGHKVYMFACGLALTPEAQRENHMPNMAAFTGIRIADDDPLHALVRLAKWESRTPLSDLLSIIKNAGLVITSVGRKLINYRKIPERVRRMIADAAVLLDANLVAREFVGGGRGRRLEYVSLNIISEQPPDPENRITLIERTDRLGLRLAHVHWEISMSLREDMVRFVRLLTDDLDKAGIKGLRLAPAFESGDLSELLIHDMAHTAGTTRMGIDPATSVVDPTLQVHGVQGLYVTGASVFPTSGHANPTQAILALTIRLADKLKKEHAVSQVAALSNLKASQNPTSIRRDRGPGYDVGTAA